jgi:3-phenylpropionate/trans-cinnamate dioxygenase ferredoxin subunit
MEWLKIFESEEHAKNRIKENSAQLLIVNGKRICLARYKGEFFAVQDSCTHHGESLSKGKVNFLGEIICPLHNYRFKLDSGRASDSSCGDLLTYAVKSSDSGFFIGV